MSSDIFYEMMDNDVVSDQYDVVAGHWPENEHELVLGNIIGSNFFNTLGVVGVATAISPLVPSGDTPAFSPYILTRDLPFVAGFSLSLLVLGFNWRHPSRPGRFGRFAAVVWLASFVVYAALMLIQETR